MAAYTAEFMKSAVRVSAADVQPEQAQVFTEVADEDVPFDVPSSAPADEAFAPIE